MDFKKLFGNMAILGLLVFAIISFITITQIDNDVLTPITDNELINRSYNDLNTNLSNVQAGAQSSSDTFEGVTPPTSNTDFGELEVTKVVSPTKIFKSIAISGLWNVYIALPVKILGVDPIVAGLISSIILLLFAIAVWAIFKGAIQN